MFILNFHIFLKIVPFNNYTIPSSLLLAIEYLGCLPLFAVIIYSKHFYACSFSLVLNTALGFIPGMPPFVLLGVSVCLSNRRLNYLLC